MAITKYDTTEWKYVPVKAGSVTLNYGFRTNIKGGDSSDLGHAPLTNSINNVVIGCRYPKPTRAVKKDAIKVTSSFVSNSSAAGAKASGYSLITSRASSPFGPKAKVKSMQVEVGGVNYGWFMPNTTHAKVSSFLSQLGISEMTTDADFKKAVAGANFPRPARVNLLLSASGAEGVSNNISTFCEANADIAAIAGGAVMGVNLGEAAIDDLALYLGLG